MIMTKCYFFAYQFCIEFYWKKYLLENIIEGSALVFKNCVENNTFWLVH